MENRAKKLYEKMVDLKRFAVIILAAGAFFYLGVIIPSEKNTMDLNIMIMASTVFIAISLLLFINAKNCQEKLQAMEEDEEFL